MAPTHFSFRKLWRKIRQDGIETAVLDSVETLYRRFFYTHIFQFLSKRGYIRVLQGGDLQDRANYTVDLDLEGRGPAYELNSGYVFSDTGLVVTDDLEVIAQSVGNPPFSKRFTIESLAHQDFSRASATPRILQQSNKEICYTEVPENICPLIPRYDNYYHWMVGTVPKIRYIERYEEKTGKSVTFLLPHNSSPWVQQTFSLLGCPSDKFISAQSPIYKPKNIIIPPHPFPGQLEDYKWIRQRVLDNLDTNHTKQSTERIYISRDRAIARQVSNEDELMEILVSYGFKKYHLEDQTLSENVRLFSNADIVVSPHGAGLTDIIFCEDAKIVELFGSQKTNSYEELSNCLGLSYHHVDCDPNSTDIFVDTVALQEIIEIITT